jgi:hypothetical protein
MLAATHRTADSRQGKEESVSGFLASTSQQRGLESNLRAFFEILFSRGFVIVRPVVQLSSERMRLTMKYGFVFLLVVAIAVVEIYLIGGWAWLLLWPALAFALLAAAYFGVGPRLLGKRSDGTMSPVAVLAMLPFFAFLWMLWRVQRLLSKEPAYHEIAPGLWLGRRLLPREMPQGCQRVVDLTAEFIEPAGVRAGFIYHGLPTLDAAVPSLDALCDLAKHIASTPTPTLVHCASGHGRSALFVACVLLARGDAHSPDEAIARLKAMRPGVGLSVAQRKMLEACASRTRTG